MLVDTIGWRFAFLINVPVLAVALWVTRRYIVESRDVEGRGRFDWLGSVVAALAVGGLSFGIIRGGEKEWADPVAWSSIVIGTIALVAFPVMMRVRRDPLVPLWLFTSRAFSTINLATFFIYGGLYVTLSYAGIVLQGVLGYTALAAGASLLPMGLALSFLSTRIGTLAGRIGARRFMTVGPLVMVTGLLWFARLPSDSERWVASLEQPSTLIPPVSFVTDVLPATLLFGIGISLIVAPLTNTLMGSIPGRFSGLGSAINNAISRVGQPLLGALIFVVISATFYTHLAAVAPDLALGDAAVRMAYPPLNPPPAGATPDQVAAATEASIRAFHDAMRIAAALLAIGAVVSWIGLRGTDHGAEPMATPEPSADGVHA